MRIDVAVPPEDAGRRADAVLAEQLEGQTRSSVQRLIAAGAVTCGGAAVAKNRRVSPGEIYAIDVPEPEPTAPWRRRSRSTWSMRTRTSSLSTNRAAWLCTRPQATATARLSTRFCTTAGRASPAWGGVLRPGIVHRIDRDTSGLLVAAKNDDAHRGLAAQLADHTMFRVYSAVLVGTPNPETGTINAPIGRDPRDRKRMAVTARGGKPAVTHYRVLERFTGVQPRRVPPGNGTNAPNPRAYGVGRTSCGG